jgi:hypothetical protein
VKKHLLCFFIIGIALGGALFAQSNAFVDKLIDEKQATYGEAAFMALASAGLVKPEGAVTEAIAYMDANKWGFVKKADEPVTLGDLCYMLMRAFNFTGGIMYTVAPGPRYAAREFEYQGWVRRSPVPSRFVGGEEVLQVLAAREGVAP